MLARILAIAGLTVRAALRSRVIALLMILVVAGVTALPLVIKSDGTPAGLAQLFLHYAFGLVVIILSVAAAWIASGAVALDVAARHMDVLMTKPVHAAEVWLGKWLGLMLINMSMLALAGALVYAGLRWTPSTAQSGGPDQTLDITLAAHSRIPACERGTAHVIIAPGAEHAWRFALPEHTGSADALFLQFRFDTSRIERQTPVTGLWRVTADAPSTPILHQATDTPHVPHTFKLAGAGPGKAGRTVTVTYRNVETNDPATVVFAPDTGVVLLATAGSFEDNFFRALLLTLARLAFLAALGLTAGALFSFPVAVFTAFAFLCMTGLIEWISPDAALLEAGPAPAWLTSLLNAVTRGVVKAAHILSPPFARFDPLDFMPTGLAISWSLVLSAWAVLALAYGGAVALLGIGYFHRREIGSATQ